MIIPALLMAPTTSLCRGIAFCLVTLLVQTVTAQSDIERLSSGEWRERNQVAAALLARSATLGSAEIDALWAVATPEFPVGDRGSVAVREGYVASAAAKAVVRVRHLDRESASLAPRGVADLVIPFSPAVLAALVIEARPGELPAERFDACLDAALHAADSSERLVIGRLLARYGPRGLRALQARLAVDAPGRSSSNSRLVLMGAMDLLGAPGRAVILEYANDSDPQMRRSAWLTLSGSTAQPGELPRAAAAVVTDPECVGEALGVLETNADGLDEATWRVLADACQGDGPSLSRTLAALAALSPGKQRVAVVVAALEHLLVQRRDSVPLELLLPALARHVDVPSESLRAALLVVATNGEKAFREAAVDILHAVANRDDGTLGALLADPALSLDALRRVSSAEPRRWEPTAVGEQLDRAFQDAVRAAPSATRVATARGFSAQPLRVQFPGLVAWLRGELQSGDGERRTHALEAIAVYGRDLPDLLPDLKAMLPGPSAKREEVWSALVAVAPGELPGALVAGAVPAASPWRERVVGLPQAELEALWQHSRAKVRESAASWLSLDPAAVAAFGRGLLHDDRKVRYYSECGLVTASRRQLLPESLRDSMAASLRQRLADAEREPKQRLDAARTLKALALLQPNDLVAMVELDSWLSDGLIQAWHSSTGFGEPPLPTRADVYYAVEKMMPAQVPPAVVTWIEAVAARTDPLYGPFEGHFRALRLRLAR